VCVCVCLCIWGPCTGIEAALAQLKTAEVYVEKWVPYTKELAVVVARGLPLAAGGPVPPLVAYATVETIQQDSICHVVVAPAQIDGLVAAQAREVALKAVATLEGAGVYGVELFMLDDGMHDTRERVRKWQTDRRTDRDPYRSLGDEHVHIHQRN
jgi:phosphoribosylaminoimidazole carboxylase (NCAIR synthetase)